MSSPRRHRPGLVSPTGRHVGNELLFRQAQAREDREREAGNVDVRTEFAREAAIHLRNLEIERLQTEIDAQERRHRNDEATRMYRQGYQRVAQPLAPDEIVIGVDMAEIEARGTVDATRTITVNEWNDIRERMTGRIHPADLLPLPADDPVVEHESYYIGEAGQLQDTYHGD